MLDGGERSEPHRKNIRERTEYGKVSDEGRAVGLYVTMSKEKPLLDLLGLPA